MVHTLKRSSAKSLAALVDNDLTPQKAQKNDIGQQFWLNLFSKRRLKEAFEESSRADLSSLPSESGQLAAS